MEICKMKKSLKEQLKRIGGLKLNEEIIEFERIDDLEARIFDQIMDFKKTFEKSDWKKDRKVNAIIKQLMKLEVRLSQAVRDANK